MSTTWVMRRIVDDFGEFCPVDFPEGEEAGYAEVITGLTVMTTITAMQSRSDCRRIVEVDDVYEATNPRVLWKETMEQ